MRSPKILLPLILLTSCARSEAPNTEAGVAPNPLTQGSGEVLAEVGKATIRASQFVGRVNEQSPLRKKQYQRDKRALLKQLETMIEEQLLLEIAKERGYHRDPRIQQMIRQHLVRLVREDIYKTVKLADFKDADVKAHYEKNKERFRLPLRIRARQIVVATEQEAKGLVKSLAKADDKSFAQTARKISIDVRTKGLGGDLGWRGGRSPKLKKALWEPLSKLKKGGELAGPVKTKGGWHVLRVTAIQPSRIPALEEIALQVKMQAYRATRAQKMSKLLVELRRRFPVKRYPARLGSLQDQIQ